MNHPAENELVMLAYGELEDPRAAEIETHVTRCHACAEALARFERARVALDVAMHAGRRPAILWAGLALAAAAGLAGVVITRSGPVRNPVDHWTPTTTWSTTAGYVTGGRAMMDIDAQLTRLERERYYGLPN